MSETNQPTYTDHQLLTNRRLRVTFFVSLLACCVLFVLGQTNVIPNGVIAPSYGLQILSVVLTLAVVPGALKMLSLASVRRQIAGNLCRYQRWALLRMGSLYGVLVVDLLIHFLMIDVSALYCALIVAVALLYVKPDMNRLMVETAPYE